MQQQIRCDDIAVSYVRTYQIQQEKGGCVYFMLLSRPTQNYGSINHLGSCDLFLSIMRDKQSEGKWS